MVADPRVLVCDVLKCPPLRSFVLSHTIRFKRFRLLRCPLTPIIQLTLVLAQSSAMEAMPLVLPSSTDLVLYSGGSDNPPIVDSIPGTLPMSTDLVPYAGPDNLSVMETSSTFALDILDQRVRVVTAVSFEFFHRVLCRLTAMQYGAERVAHTVIDEQTLRALIMRSLICESLHSYFCSVLNVYTGYIDRECIPLSNARVAFVGSTHEV